MYWPHPLWCLPGIELRIPPVPSNHQTENWSCGRQTSLGRRPLVWEETGSGCTYENEGAAVLSSLLQNKSY
jgi:hypothetical protein